MFLRFYWKSTKLDETTAAEVSAKNPYKFLPLPYFACDAEGLRNALLPNKEGGLAKESVVFYNKETDYTLGYSPLVCALDLTSEDGQKMAHRLLTGELNSMQWYALFFSSLFFSRLPFSFFPYLFRIPPFLSQNIFVP